MSSSLVVSKDSDRLWCSLWGSYAAAQRPSFAPWHREAARSVLGARSGFRGVALDYHATHSRGRPALPRAGPGAVGVLAACRQTLHTFWPQLASSRSQGRSAHRIDVNSWHTRLQRRLHYCMPDHVCPTTFGQQMDKHSCLCVV